LGVRFSQRAPFAAVELNTFMKSSIKTYECRNCKKLSQITRQKNNIYCSNVCQKEFEYKERIRIWKETGVIGATTLKRHLATIKNCCWVCGIKGWNGKELGLELEHIDGNADNNSESNVCLICPNCHSQTSTYKAKNKGNGRAIRRERYHKARIAHLVEQ
jgi:hypothetical protein